VSWRFGISSDIGGRAEQQDRAEIFESEKRGDYLIVLADGMGGHHGGALAAQAVVDSSCNLFESSGINDPLSDLESLCLQAHKAVTQIGNQGGQTPGSTCVMLYVSGDEAYWAHVGDSRLYHFRNGKLQNRTSDHSLVQLLVSRGELSEAEMATSPLQNQLYMRLGGEEIPKPEIGSAEVHKGDAFMLCSDGFWESIDEDEVSAILNRDDLEGAVEQLVKVAKERGGTNGDNITMAIAQMGKLRKKFFRFF
jgi:serine/threonine protein phosphatase PrpC